MLRLPSVSSSRAMIYPSLTSRLLIHCEKEKACELVLEEGESYAIVYATLLKGNKEDKKPLLVHASMGNEPFPIASFDAKTGETKPVDFFIPKSCKLSHTGIDSTVVLVGDILHERPWRIAVDDDEISDEDCEKPLRVAVDNVEFGDDDEIGDADEIGDDDDEIGDDADVDDDMVDFPAYGALEPQTSANVDDDMVDSAAYREKQVAAHILQMPSLETIEDSDQVSKEVTHQVYFNIEIDGRSAGQIVFGLYGKAVPKTAENFVALCTGEKRMGESGNYYRGSKFHRVRYHYAILGGALADGHNKAHLTPENLKMRPDGPGLLVMTNNTVSEFLITIDPVRVLFPPGCRAVTIGKVLAGMEVVYKIVAKAASYGLPRANVTIAECGQL